MVNAAIKFLMGAVALDEFYLAVLPLICFIWAMLLCVCNSISRRCFTSP